MPKIGVIVGLDGLGKTPLTQMIQKINPDVQVRKIVRNPLDDSSTGVNLALEEVRWWKTLKDELVLYDRFPWPDDWIYEAVGGASKQGGPTRDHEDLEHAVLAADVRYVYIAPQAWKEYIRKFSDPIIKVEMLPEMRQRYSNFITRCDKIQIPVMHVPAMWFDIAASQRIYNWLFSFDG